MEEKLSLFGIFSILKKRWKLILIIIIASALISGTVTFYLLQPVYQASTQILVNQKTNENQLDLSHLQSNVDLINTYSVIIKSPAILEKVMNKLDFNQSIEQLNQKMTITSQENSQVFSLIIEDSDPSKAVEIANIVSDTFQEEIPSIMNVNNVSILARAELKDHPVPVKPKPLFNIVIGVLAGIMASIGTALLLEFLDKTLKDDQDVEKCLGLPVLGTIPKISKNSKTEKRNKKSKKQGAGSEQIVSYAEK